jgi:hypothetical protein
MDSKVSQKVKVLYQNLGGTWYAFAQNGEEVYFGKVPILASPEETLEHLKAQQKLNGGAKHSSAQRRNRRQTNNAA